MLQIRHYSRRILNLFYYSSQHQRRIKDMGTESICMSRFNPHKPHYSPAWAPSHRTSSAMTIHHLITACKCHYGEIMGYLVHKKMKRQGTKLQNKKTDCSSKLKFSHCILKWPTSQPYIDDILRQNDLTKKAAHRKRVKQKLDDSSQEKCVVSPLKCL